MRIGIFGSGSVARTLGSGFARLGHDVMLGTRTKDNPNATLWRDDTGGLIGSLDEAAAFGAVLINALNGAASLDAIGELNAEAMSGKVLIDVANPLDFSNGFPPSFTVSNTDSLAEQLQRALPDVHVVKALNTVNTSVMIDPGALHEDTDLFICGNDATAKDTVMALLVELGWTRERLRDLGDLSAARGTEAYLALWVRLMSSLGTPTFNVRVVAE
jgi:8-hydroxy-5-deazaflavin:NADPH oxidoreductase